MKFANARKLDTKSGVRLGEGGAPVHCLWRLLFFLTFSSATALAVFGCEFVCVVVHFARLRRAG